MIVVPHMLKRLRMRFNKDWETAEPIAAVAHQPSAPTTSQRLMTTVTTSSGIVIAPQIQLLKRPTTETATPTAQKEPDEAVPDKGISFQFRQKAYETARARIYSEPDPKNTESHSL